MRTCTACGESKKDESFQLRGDGTRRAQCRKCRRSVRRKVKLNDGTRKCIKCGMNKSILEFKQKGLKTLFTCVVCWEQQHSGLCKCSKPAVVGRTSCLDCLERDRIQSRDHKLLMRKTVLDYLGCKCAYCGIDEQMFLTIDHVNGGGKVHRRESKDPNICSVLYRQLKREGNLSEGFQILCWNCNSAKHIHGELAVRAAIERLKSR